MIFQDIRLIPNWTVLENIWMPLYLLGMAQDQAPVCDHWLEQVGMADFMVVISIRSGGQKYGGNCPRVGQKAKSFVSR